MVPDLNWSNGTSVFNLSQGEAKGSPAPVAGLSRTAHSLVAVCLGCILVLGSLHNSLVVLIFVKFKAIRTPINMVLLNISASDLLVCIFGTPFSFAASVSGRWLFGHQCCKWYGFSNSLFGIVSLVSLSILSYERYITVRKGTKADMSNYRDAWIGILVSWSYSLLWTMPPLFGWSSYGPESSGTTCSVLWHVRSTNNVSYIVCLFLFCLVLPLLVMIFCYVQIVKEIRRVCRINLTAAQKREHRILFMVVCMVTCYLLCWMPYGLVSLMATFGKPGLITPTISIIPSILAKTSTFLNPLIYFFMNKQFYRCFVALLKGQPDPHDSDIVFNSRQSKELHIGATCQPENSIFHSQGKEMRKDTRSSNQERLSLTLVAHYRK
ncbi:pinopsin-like isoform X2 [Ascaphus truei]|uniref:pinopsin-like isoform X2 n=1 Tax=Ascaphus truei TaxID=8439 RepID=UPI003F591F7F